MRSKLLAIFAVALTVFQTAAVQGLQTAETASWRDDAANIAVVRGLNSAYRLVPFSTQYEGVLDDQPVEIDWTVGPELPMPCKGSVSGVFGDEIVIAGGAWLDNKPRAVAYNVRTRSYADLPPPPMNTGFAQGASDGRYLYLVGGKSAGRTAVRLGKTGDGRWQWTRLPDVPEAARWTAAVNVVGRWLVLYSGRTQREAATLDPDQGPAQPASGSLNLSSWRLRLDDAPNPKWEPMAAYPGPACCVLNTAVARGKVYAFGGWRDAEAIKKTLEPLELWKKHRIYSFTPANWIAYRNAYAYDPEKNSWTAIRGLPFPMYGGAGVVLRDRYILLMGISDKHTMRVGRSDTTHKPYLDQYWKGYGDVIVGYDVEKGNYFRVGLMLYGVSSWNWAMHDNKIYSFGGEPWHSLHSNRESVLQIGTIRRN